MLTVPQAAARAGRDPETIRRWIRSGRLRASKVGTQHVIDDRDLSALLEDQDDRAPDGWDETFWGEPMPDVVAAVRRSRAGR